MQTYQILMVGPTRVGKTSTLASMSDSLQTAVSKLGYHTTIPDTLLQTVRKFEDCVKQNEFVVTTLPMKDGTASKTAYPIDLISQNQEKDIRVEFIDVPGAWFIPPTQERFNANYDDIKTMLKSSVASLWCVDCVSMIEGHNDPSHDYHKERNEPKLIAELYKNLDSMVPNHRLVFVLMRAETYHHNKNQGPEWLINKFNESYGRFVDEIKHRFPDMEIYVTSVETLGCFMFKSWQTKSETGELDATYMKYADKYTPKNCESPALLVIDRVLQKAVSFYEAKKAENLAYFKTKRKGEVARLLIGLVRQCFGGLLGDPNEFAIIEDIYQALLEGKTIDSNGEYAKVFNEHPDLNAHVILERLKTAASTMRGLVIAKKSDNLIHLL